MDELLLKRAQSGDTAAFEQLITPLENRVWRTCVHLLGATEDAKDCAQDVMVKAWRNLRDFRGDSALETWLHRLCVTTCLDYLRRVKARPAVSMDAMSEAGYDPPSRAPTPETAALARERTEQLRQAIADLPEDSRDAFTLVVLEEMDYERAATLLNVPMGTLKSRVFRARMRLQKIFSSHGELSRTSRVQPNERRTSE